MSLKTMDDVCARLDYLTKLVETHIEETKPCSKSKGAVNMDDVNDILSKSPLASNPMFKKAFEKMFDSAKVKGAKP